MIALAAILGHRVTWWAAAAILIGGAVLWHGKSRHAAGYRHGLATEAARRDSIQRIADVQADAMRVRTDSVIHALQLRLAEKDRAILVARQATARAAGQYASALADYEALKALQLASGDTLLTPRERACDEVATACAINLAAEQTEKAAILERLSVADSVVAEQQANAAAEPARTATAAKKAVQMDRATRQEPSRLRWALFGATAAVAAWLVPR